MRFRGSSGQALVEAAITFPLHVLVVLGILQAGLLSIGKGFTEYAAFAAARAALTEPEPGEPRARARRMDPRQAAAIALLPAVPAPATSPAGRIVQSFRGIPGAGLLADPARLAAARARTRVEIRNGKAGVRARVAHDFALVVPVANRFFAWGGRLFGRLPPPVPGFPSLRLEGECALPR